MTTAALQRIPASPTIGLAGAFIIFVIVLILPH
jgi:hypothetical protein